MPSVQTRSSSPQTTVTDLKHRVITCLNRLSDRDTLSLAAAELDSIALSLSPESFPLFLNCLQTTDSSAKPPVRKHCVSLLSLLSRSHGDSLAPHLPKMLSTLLRRLRDPDSTVRAACAAASADMAASITEAPFSAISGPLVETLVHDCDHNAQTGAAACLAAAVCAAGAAPDVEELRRALPRIGKLLKSDGFKAKAELLGAIGSVIAAVGGYGDRAVLDWLVPNVMEFLGSEDWRARKAAAEAMARVATAEEELAPLYKKACVGVLESRRFDKVKVVRETMTHTLRLWRSLRDEDESSFSSSKGKRSKDKNTNDVEESEAREKRNHLPLGAKRAAKPKPKASKVKENGSNKSQAVVQSSDEEESSSKNDAEEELTLIRNQITKIEEQQSSLVDLFQRFMESSQNEMQSLGRRVRCLETSFSVLSTDLLVSRNITQNGNHKRNTNLQS